MKKLLLLVPLLAAAVASAQRPGRPAQGPGGPGGQGGPGRGQARPDDRRELEMQVRQRFARIVRERVGLNDEQMGKLGTTTRRFEQQRQELQGEERLAREAMRDVMTTDQTVDTAKVKQAQLKLREIRRKRLQLMEAEEDELGTFMTPIQVARFLGLQEQVRRQLEQMRPPQDRGPEPDMPPRGRRRPPPSDSLR